MARTALLVWRTKNPLYKVGNGGREDGQAVGEVTLTAGPFRMLRVVDEALRVWHQTENSSAGVAETGHVQHAPVRVVRERRRATAVRFISQSNAPLFGNFVHALFR